jgi:hypothetical protein
MERARRKPKPATKFQEMIAVGLVRLPNSPHLSNGRLVAEIRKRYEAERERRERS